MKIKSVFRILSAFTVISMLLSGCSNDDDTETRTETAAEEEKIVLSLPGSAISDACIAVRDGTVSNEIRGVWIASVYNINFPSAPDLSEDELKSELDEIVKNVEENGLNTVYFQVHPSSDALYRSDIFPVSTYLYSDGVLHFDPLEYMAEVCDEKGISLYAWVNPLRITVDKAKTAEDARNSLPESSPGRIEDLTVFYGDGKLYLNCGSERVRELVADTVDEIISGYNVDGIVFDDYFYPYPKNDANGNPYVFDDKDEYSAANTELSLDDWRRDNVNKLIKQCYDRVKAYNPDKKFGVAPFGIWQNNDGLNGGSDTTGMEAYSALYCDAAAWIKGGYIDFVSPQLYWECTNTAAPFGELARFWNSLTEGTGVDLIVSHGIYRYDNDWKNPSGELIKQVDITRELSSYAGSMLYGYAVLESNTSGASDDTREVFGCETYIYSSGKSEIESVIFSGYSDSGKTITVNGIPISMGHNGYFECELSLAPGTNKYTFANGTDSTTMIFIKKN